MLTLIFALAVRLVAHVAGAVAARLSRFLAVSLLGLAAGKMSSLAGVDARRVFAPPPLTRRPPLLPRTQAMRGSTFSVISMKD